MDTSFAIKIEPIAPVILGRRLNLCALLSYHLLEELRQQGVDEKEALERAHTEIPLVQAHGVFSGSSAMFARTKITTRTYYGSLTRHLEVIPDIEKLIKKNETNRKNGRAFDHVRKRFPNIESHYECLHLNPPNLAEEAQRAGDGLWFLGHGDRAVAERLLKNMRHIGTKRTPIKPPQFFDAEPSAVPGIMTKDGIILRPVPCTARIKPKRFLISYERIRPPYWSGEQVECYVPPVRMWSSNGQIETMLGVQYYD